MPWNHTARDQHNRDHLRYPGDLTDHARALEGREASPTAGVIDSQSVKPRQAHKPTPRTPSAPEPEADPKNMTRI